MPLIKSIGRKQLIELTLVGDDDPLTMKRRRKLDFLFFPCLKTVDQIIPISSQLNSLTLRAGIDPSRVRQIPVGVDTTLFHPVDPSRRVVLKKELGLDIFDQVLISVGRIEERKRWEIPIAAFGRIVADYPKAVYLIIGPSNDNDNPYYQKLLRLVAEKNLQGKVLFLGKRANVSDYMKAADCLLHAALKEGLPNTLVEAACCALPIVCRRMEGIAGDIIINDRVGFELDSDDPLEYKNRGDVLLSLGEVPQENGAVPKLHKKFAIQRVAKQYHDLFNNLCELT
jgi:glycosyltransferase involved in cell wall biosynthesis